MKPFKLEDIDKSKPDYKVPDGYFEELPMKIQARISSEKHVNWYQLPVFRIAAPIAAVLLIVITYVVVSPSDPSKDLLAKTAEEWLTDVSGEDLLAYVDEMNLEEEEILTAFEQTLNEAQFSEESLDDLNFEEGMLDDVLLEYDLSEEYL